MVDLSDIRFKVAAIILVSGCTPPPAWTSHHQLLDRDLEAHDPTERDRMEGLTRTLGFKSRDDFRGWIAFFSVLRNDQGALRWAFVWLEPANRHPGYSRVRVGILDASGQILDDSIFLSGWRHLDFTGVSKLSRQNAPDVLLIRSEGLPGLNRRQYYALAGNHLELVRLEAEKPPELQSNHYGSPNHTVGPLYPPANEEECVGALEGASWTRRLSMLTWLGGYHWDGSNANLWHEDEKVAMLARTLQSIPRVRASMQNLSGSSDAWIREAASLALNPSR